MCFYCSKILVSYSGYRGSSLVIGCAVLRCVDCRCCSLHERGFVTQVGAVWCFVLLGLPVVWLGGFSSFCFSLSCNDRRVIVALPWRIVA